MVNIFTFISVSFHLNYCTVTSVCFVEFRLHVRARYPLPVLYVSSAPVLGDVSILTKQNSKSPCLSNLLSP